MKPVLGPLDPLKQVPDRENALPILHHSGVLRKMNGDFDSMPIGFTGICYKRYYCDYHATYSNVEFSAG